ncbi:MAG: hypothetical protein KME32_26295 [Mojavia pulchra JT2-VF2]|uniref:Uncharacterized protein n=1 Tax=Mojavia pulchra JT2-VF2 TaxID=287848 RepID=A0A951Q4S2_9NOST|nr:hypothetical protein [Mojavia pulchra JT2-VF2]
MQRLIFLNKRAIRVTAICGRSERIPCPVAIALNYGQESPSDSWGQRFM